MIGLENPDVDVTTTNYNQNQPEPPEQPASQQPFRRYLSYVFPTVV